MAHGIDYESEGLLEGAGGGAARAARTRLVEHLVDRGIDLADIKRAVSEERLPLLGVERSLAQGGEYSANDIARSIGADPANVMRLLHATGLPRSDGDAAVFSETTLEFARALKLMIDEELPQEELEDVARAIGQGVGTIASAVRGLVAATIAASETLDEYELAIKLEDAEAHILPVAGPALQTSLRHHLLQGIRRDAVHAAEVAGHYAGYTDVVIAFADLVGFTRLGEGLDPPDLGRVASRLAAIAVELIDPPVRLVKTIGDAVMLASNDVGAVLETTLELVSRVEADPLDLPDLRAGVATGPATLRGGDWFGRPVNLASRLTAVARPGTVLASEQVRDAAPDGFTWSRTREFHFKGVSSHVVTYRVRRNA